MLKNSLFQLKQGNNFSIWCNNINTYINVDNNKNQFVEVYDKNNHDLKQIFECDDTKYDYDVKRFKNVTDLLNHLYNMHPDNSTGVFDEFTVAIGLPNEHKVDFYVHVDEWLFKRLNDVISEQFFDFYDLVLNLGNKNITFNDYHIFKTFYDNY